MVKVFTTNKDGKIEFTKDELEKLLDEVWRDGYNSNSSYWWKSPQWTSTSPLWTYTTVASSPNTISADGLTSGDITMKGNIITSSNN